MLVKFGIFVWIFLKGCISALMPIYLHVHTTCVLMYEVFLYGTEIDSVWVYSAEGIQCSSRTALGSPSINRDVGMSKPVYISFILTGTSQPRIRQVSHTCIEIHGSRFLFVCIILKSSVQLVGLSVVIFSFYRWKRKLMIHHSNKGINPLKLVYPF